MKQTNNIREISVLIGVIAGFTFLISFFAGFGVSAEKTFLSGVFFVIITVVIMSLLFSVKKNKGNSR